VAENLLGTITLSKDYSSPAGFDQGDTIYGYWDDVAEVVVVKKADNSVTVDAANVTTWGDNGTFETAGTESNVLGANSGSRQAAAARTGSFGLRFVAGATVPTSNTIFRFNVTNGASNTYIASCYVRVPAGNSFSTNNSTQIFLDALSDTVASQYVSIIRRNFTTVGDALAGWVKLTCTFIYNAPSLNGLIIDLSAYAFIGVKTNVIASELVPTTGYLHLDDVVINAQTGFTNATPATITAGPDLGYVDPSQVTGCTNDGQNVDVGFGVIIFTVSNYFSNYSFVTGLTTLNRFKIIAGNPTFPYFNYFLETGSPTVCNLTATITNIQSPTSQYAGDGRFTVTSTTSLAPAKYSLSDVAYAAMENTTGIFTNLLPGDYKVYIRDLGECRQSLIVTIPKFRGDEVKYRMEFVDIQNQTKSRVDILERGFGGTLRDVDGFDAVPFKITQPQISINNKFETILPISADIVLKNKINYEFETLFSQSDKQFRVNYYRPVGALIWSGYLQSSVFSEEFIAPPYGTNAKVIDGLALLKDIDFRPEGGGLFDSFMSMKDVLITILSKTELNLPLRTAINIYEFNHAKGIDDDPLAQTYVNTGEFVDNPEEVNPILIKPWKCSRVIEYILEPFGAQIKQWEGRWNVYEVDTQTSSYNYRDYDYLGAFISSGTYNPIYDIKAPSLRENIAFADYNHVREIVPAYKQIQVTQKLFPKTNVLKNGNFAKFNASSLQWDNWNYIKTGLPNGYATIGTVPELAARFILDVSNIAFPYAKDTHYFTFESDATDVIFSGSDSFELSFKHAVIYENLLNNELFGAPLYHPLKWGVSLTYLNTEFFYSEAVSWNSNTAFKYNELYLSNANSVETKKVNIPSPTSYLPVFGRIKVFFLIPSAAYRRFTTAAELRDIPTVNMPTATRLKGNDYSAPTAVLQYQPIYYKLKSSTAAESVPAIIRPTDYAAATNEVVWEREDRPAEFEYTPKEYQLQSVALKFLPNRYESPDSSTAYQLVNNDYRESLTVEIEGGDVPVNYLNNRLVWFLVNKIPTKSWARVGDPYDLNAPITIQKHLLNRLVKQYQRSTTKISGGFIGFDDLGFLNIPKLTFAATSVTLANPEMNTVGVAVTGWQNYGAATPAWDGLTNQARLVLIGGQGDSKYFINTATVDILSGSVVRIETSIVRTGATTRQDDFIACFFSGGVLVQTASVSRVTTDNTIILALKLTLGQTIDNLGFYVKNYGDSSAATYLVDYFRVSVLQQIRYYALNSVSRDDRNNDYQLELIQLVPLVTTNDVTTVDDGTLDVITTRAFSDGFSDGFS
jgi:hypothetical protein